MDQKLATKRKISSQTQNSFFITEQQIVRLTQKVIRELEHEFKKKHRATCYVRSIYNAMAQLSGGLFHKVMAKDHRSACSQDWFTM